jgi:hypothetical protein
MKKVIVRDYNSETYECLIVESKTRLLHILHLRFYYFYEQIAPGTVLHLPEKLIKEAERRRLIYGPIGVSPLAQAMPVSQDEFMFVEQKEKDGVLLQRYYGADSDGRHA